MSFDVTTADIKSALTPLGFDVEVDSQFDDEEIIVVSNGHVSTFADERYIRITHPDHKGIVIEAVVLDDDKTFEELDRKVEGGVEATLYKRTTQESFDALTDSQRAHLFNIDFGEPLDHENLNSMSDFVQLVQTKIVPITVL